MKNIKKLLFLIVLIIPIFISAKTDIYDSSVSKANQYIFNNVFESRNKYLYYDSPLYGVDNSGKAITSDGYTTGGMLNKYEYEVSIKNGFSYLVIPNKFWTMSISDNNLPYYLDGKGIAKTVVTGEGTLNNPWEFVNSHYAILTTSNKNVGYFQGGRESEEVVINSDGNAIFSLEIVEGYENDPSDGCKLQKDPDDCGNNYCVKELKGDYNCVVKFKQKPYIITYNKNTTDAVNNMPVNQSKTHGTNITLSNSTPTRTGYTFDGWYENSSCIGTKYSQGGNYTKNENTTLYAKWNPNKFTVAYNINGGTGGSTASHDCTYDSDCILASNGFTKTGYTFSGWKKDNAGSILLAGASIKNDATSGTVTYYAQWNPNKFTVAYNKNGGTGGSTSSHECKYDNNCYLSNNEFTREGFQFSGWKKDNTGDLLSVETNIKNVVTSGTVTYYAQWISNNFTVTYNKNTTDSVSGMPNNQTKIHGTALTLSSSKPTREGYYFVGWNTNSNGNGTNYSAGGTYTANQNVTLYAKWVKIYYADFDNAEGTTWLKSCKTNENRMLETSCVEAIDKICRGWVEYKCNTYYYPGKGMVPNCSNQRDEDTIWVDTFRKTYVFSENKVFYCKGGSSVH